MDFERYKLIRELIQFNLNTTLDNIEINRIGVDLNGDPEIIQITGQCSLGKSYKLDCQYSEIKSNEDIRELSKHFFEMKESII